MRTWLINLRSRSLALRGAVLASVVLVLLAVVGPIGWVLGGEQPLFSLAMARSPCSAACTTGRLVQGYPPRIRRYPSRTGAD